MVTNGQIKKIHTLKNVLRLDDELYREILSDYGANSCKRLPAHLVDEFIKTLERMAIEAGVWINPLRKYENLNNRENMANAKQIRMLEAMWSDFILISHEQDKEEQDADKLKTKSFRTFLRNKYGISDVRFITKDKVTKIKQGISVMIKRKLKED